MKTPILKYYFPDLTSSLNALNPKPDFEELVLLLKSRLDTCLYVSLYHLFICETRSCIKNSETFNADDNLSGSVRLNVDG